MAVKFSYTMIVQLEYIDDLLKFFIIYAGILCLMFSDLLCWHNQLVPKSVTHGHPVSKTYIATLDNGPSDVSPKKTANINVS